MKYERLENSPLDNAIFQYVGVYPAEKDYVDWSDHRPNYSKIFYLTIYGVVAVAPIVELLLVCVCATVGKFFCANGEKEVVCPGCNETLYFNDEADGADFDITRARG